MPEKKNTVAPEDKPAGPRRAGPFWQGLSFEELARLQGVGPVERLEDLLGGWPEDEIDDGFEEAVLRWRQQDVIRPEKL
jgi:hypothetical protein